MTAGGPLDVARLVIRAGMAVFDYRFWVPGLTGPTGPCLPAPWERPILHRPAASVSADFPAFAAVRDRGAGVRACP